jgi:hypothetical protein
MYTRNEAAALMYSHGDENVRFWARAYYRATFTRKMAWGREQAHRGLAGAMYLFLLEKNT